MGVPINPRSAQRDAQHLLPRPDGNRVELYCDMVENGFETMRTVGPRSDRISFD
jgi:hypothetical protein